MSHKNGYCLVRLIGILLCFTVINATFASEDVLDLHPMLKRYTSSLEGERYLAYNDRLLLGSTAQGNTTQSDSNQEPANSPWLTGNSIHKYLGIATLVSALATAMSAPGEDENHTGQPNVNGTHAQLGRATRALALTTVVSGLIVHWDDLHLFDDGIKDPDTQHWLLAGLGALVLADAVAKAPASGHSGQAEAGALAMAIGVKLIW